MDSAHRFFFHLQFLSGRKRGLLVGLCPFSLFFRFTTGIRNLRIHPDEKMGEASESELYGMSYSCPSFPINQSPISGTSVLGRPRDH